MVEVNCKIELQEQKYDKLVINLLLIVAYLIIFQYHICVLRYSEHKCNYYKFMHKLFIDICER